MSQQPIYIIDGTRTPFLKARGRPGPFPAADLALAAGRALLLRLGLTPDAIDQVILGCVAPAPTEANIARIVSLRLGCPEQVPAMTVQRNCASGMQAIDSAATEIRLGRAEVVLAGGAEAMSHYPVLFNDRMVAWLAAWQRARSPLARGRALLQLRPDLFVPVLAILKGLTDPVAGLSMGQTAEQLATEFDITRDAMDAFAVRSHLRLAAAGEQGRLDEVIPVYDRDGTVYEHDDGVRPDSSVEALAKLRPVFDRATGRVTAGNSAQVSDGAAMLLLASEKAVERHDLPVLGELVDSAWAGLAPERMGLGPVFAMAPIMQRHQLTAPDIDTWEINEAFAAQVLACLSAWESTDFNRHELGLPVAFEGIDQERLNPDGGAISIGHPVGASGARIVLHALKSLVHTDGERAMASLCIGGGQGGAMLLQRVH